MPDQVTLSPRVQQAVDVYDGLAERSYKGVADKMGITAGRAADYVRKGLTALGREAELPRANGESKAQPTPVTPAEMMQAEVTKLTDRITAEEGKLAEAKADAEAFDAEAFIKAEEAKLAEAVKVAQTNLKRWHDDAEGVATEAVKVQRSTLTERVTKTEGEVTATLERLR